MADRYDVAVIGAGHNGLVAAAYLARAGLSVVVLERRHLVGGAVASQEVFPGFRFETGTFRVSRLHPTLAKDIGARVVQGSIDSPTEDGEVELVPLDPAVFSPGESGDHLTLWRDPQRSADEIRRRSDRDARRLPEFAELVNRTSAFLAGLYDAPPPDLLSRRASDLLDLLRIGRRLRAAGKRDMIEILRVLPMTVAEVLDEWFETEGLKGALAGAGLTGICQGPMSGGTAFMFFHSHVGGTPGTLRDSVVVRGGSGALARALERFARSAGADIRTDAPVARILLKDSTAVAVVLDDGEEIAASHVMSNADPHRTFTQLLDPAVLDPAFMRAVSNIRYRGACARVNLALAELPRFEGIASGGELMRGLISIGPSIPYLERAYDATKYGLPSEEPHLECVIPSLIDESAAPPGQHVMSILVQYVPYRLRQGVWDDEAREELGDHVIGTLARYAPNIESAILHRQVLTPLDLETQFGLTEGNIYHGEMTLDQLVFMRPVPGWARYRTPIRNVYMCGAGTHPGGGVTGYPGFNAARRLLEDIR